MTERDEQRRPGPDSDAPLETVAAGAVTCLTLAVAFGLLALGNPFFWVAFPVGFGGGMPLVVGLVKWYRVRQERQRDARGARTERDDALSKLRDRYARGELTETELETRIERLLETESIAEAETHLGSDDDGAIGTDAAPAADTDSRESERR